MTFGTGELLDTIVKRAALPISVCFVRANHRQRRAGVKDAFLLAWPGGKRTAYAYRDDEKSATQTYFNLVQSLSQSAAPPTPADAGAQCTGPAATDSPSVAATISATAATPCETSRSGGHLAGPSGPASFPSGAA